MRIYLFIIISLLVSSCQLDLAEDKSLEKIPIFDIEIPESLTLNNEITISFKYGLVNGCYSLYEVESNLFDKNTIVTTVFAEVANSEICTQEYSEQIHSFIFTPTQAQTYYFKFWKGQNVQGVNQYEEFEFIVE